MTPYGFIYITTNLLNGKRYLGMCAYHRNNHNTYLGSGKALRRAIKKYGSNSFSREIIEECPTKEDMIAAEIRYIAEYNCVNDQSWYNMNHGGYATRGFTGKKHSEETIALMRKNYKRPETEHTRTRFKENGHMQIKRLTEHTKEYYANGGINYRAIPVTFDGVIYPSITHCRKATGLSFYKLKRLLKESKQIV